MEGYKCLSDFFRNADSENSAAPLAEPTAVPVTELATAPARLADNRKGRKKECPEELKAPIADLEKRLQSKTIDLTGQNSTRYQAVLRFLYYQRQRQGGETRQGMTLSVAGCLNRGKWFAGEFVSWEISWRKNRTIPEGKQRCL